MYDIVFYEDYMTPALHRDLFVYCLCRSAGYPDPWLEPVTNNRFQTSYRIFEKYKSFPMSILNMN